MFSALSLRIRILLFFALITFGGVTLAAGVLYYAWVQAGEMAQVAHFLNAFILFAFLFGGLVVGVWLLFDENLAKPIEQVAAGLRLRVHSGVDAQINDHAGRYLGDIVPAANSVSNHLGETALERAEEIARETERLKAEVDHLAAALSESPVATILVNGAGEIVLYDRQAAELLGSIAPLLLRSSLTDYFSEASLLAAQNSLSQGNLDAPFHIETIDKARGFKAWLKAVGDTSILLTIMDDATPLSKPPSSRPLEYDFDLLKSRPAVAIEDARLDEICFVVFDCETTGLSTETDEVVQLAAVRIVRGSIVESEVFDAYVRPNRSIPKSSTKIHGITDDDVALASAFPEVGQAFHKFAKNAVLVAHNAPFDVSFLKRSENEMGVKWRNQVLDTVLLSAVCFGVTEDHSLDALCERLSVDVTDAERHTALGDARVTAEALVKLLAFLEGRSIRTFGELKLECSKNQRILKSIDFT